jgi:hypothetical protein
LLLLLLLLDIVIEDFLLLMLRGLQDEIEALKKAVAAGDENEVDRALRGIKRELDDQLDVGTSLLFSPHFL